MVIVPSVKGVSRYLELLLVAGDAAFTGPNRVGFILLPDVGGSFYE
jgi:hypothetical protein